MTRPQPISCPVNGECWHDECSVARCQDAIAERVAATEREALIREQQIIIAREALARRGVRQPSEAEICAVAARPAVREAAEKIIAYLDSED